MPLKGQARTDYYREYMRKRRAAQKAALSAEPAAATPGAPAPNPSLMERLQVAEREIDRLSNQLEHARRTHRAPPVFTRAQFRLVRAQFHPDRAGDNPKLRELFQLITENEQSLAMTEQEERIAEKTREFDAQFREAVRRTAAKQAEKDAARRARAAEKRKQKARENAEA